MERVAVIGTVSFDVLHLASGRNAEAAGGAGLYTALAAHTAGAPTTLYAPYPHPLPTTFNLIAQRLDWRGPHIAPDDVPRLEIAHFGGGRAQLLGARWGAETALTPQDLPEDLSDYAWVHIAALRSAQRQLDFLRACRARGARRLAAGTYAHVVRAETETVRALWAEADAFFMNENEATLLFGALDAAQPHGLLFITRGAKGAIVFDGVATTALPAPSAEELDPTGAGDTFCGATLARLALGESPIIAAHHGIALASRMIGEIGPTALVERN